jgi:hypothetical protein
MKHSAVCPETVGNRPPSRPRVNTHKALDDAGPHHHHHPRRGSEPVLTRSILVETARASGPVTFEEVAATSEPLYLPPGGVPPPAEITLGLCRRVGTAPEILHPDYAFPWVSVELGVDEGLLCQPNARVVPGVLRFSWIMPARHDPGPERVRQTAASQPVWSFLKPT